MGYGRPLRTCLPSKEREEYVAHVRRRGCTSVTERLTNRYIDEFLRFLSSTANHTEPKKISASDLKNYGKQLNRKCRTLTTARIKMSIVLQWCRWLHETGSIKINPGENLTSSKLVLKSLKDTGNGE